MHIAVAAECKNRPHALSMKGTRGCLKNSYLGQATLPIPNDAAHARPTLLAVGRLHRRKNNRNQHYASLSILLHHIMMHPFTFRCRQCEHEVVYRCRNLPDEAWAAI